MLVAQRARLSVQPVSAAHSKHVVKTAKGPA